MQIGPYTIEKKAALAPMAGVADRAFRQICKDYGAAFTVSEMVSSKALCFQDRKSLALLVIDKGDIPAGIQLFGSDPLLMARAAEKAMAFAPDFIDINMGCPAPKIAGNACGSALLRDPALCGALVRAVADAVPVPVTAKIRIGYSRDDKNAVTVAEACEQGGASAITVHGRTRDQMYAPPVDLDAIRAVKRAVSVPVIGNGDVVDAKSAAAMYEQTGCDLVMVGRGALGAPWIFAQIDAWLRHGQMLPDPPLSKRLTVLYRQVELAISFKGEHTAMLEARKHAAWYMRGLRGAAALRRQAGTMNTLADLELLCAEALRSNE